MRVIQHAFFPFIEYPERWTKFAFKGVKGKEKSRPIMYASRRDSCIYSHYREILAEAYEAEIKKRGIETAVLAYRRIPRIDARGNKSNIHFAEEVFRQIRHFGDCQVYTLDISKFFENIDHPALKRLWMKLLDFAVMPADHFHVFRGVTRYASVNREKLYRALGFIGTTKPAGRIGYLVKRVPLQVCTGQVFRQEVVPLIRTNDLGRGIPQGSPISDVLANLYMLEFDTEMVKELGKVGGSYRRYCDDILLVIPGHSSNPQYWLDFVGSRIASCGGHLQIQDTKSTVHRFSRILGTNRQSCDRLLGTAGRNGLEYLGFRFDGQKIFIRDSTRSRLQRKMTFAIRAAVRNLCTNNPGMGAAALKRHFDENAVLHNFYKVRDFETHATKPAEWTFWTYIVRARRAFGEDGRAIERQVRNFRRSIRRKADRLIDDSTSLP